MIGRHHHQVGQFIDDYNEIRQDFAAILLNAGVEIGDVACAHFGKFLVALVHLMRHPLQDANHAVDLHNDRCQQMRYAVVTGELDSLGVDHNHAQGFRRVVHQQATDQRVHANGFAGTSGASDEQVRHG